MNSNFTSKIMNLRRDNRQFWEHKREWQYTTNSARFPWPVKELITCTRFSTLRKVTLSASCNILPEWYFVWLKWNLRDKLQCFSKASKPWSPLIHRREKCQMKRICHPLPVLTFLKTFKTDPELLLPNRSTNTFSYCTITKECLEMKRPEVKTLVKAWSEIQRVKGISYNLGHLI